MTEKKEIQEKTEETHAETIAASQKSPVGSARSASFWQPLDLELPRRIVGSLPWSALQISGLDREKFLHGIVTSTTKGLRAGASRLGLILTSKGRIQAEYLLLCEADRLLLLSPPGGERLLAEHLERYHIAEKVEIRRVEEAERSFAVLAGREIGAWLQSLGGTWAEAGVGVLVPPSWGMAEGAVWGSQIDALKGLESVVFWGGPQEIAKGIAALEEAGCRRLDSEEVERLRATTGWLSQGEIQGLLVHEAGIEGSHIDFKKGCFVGQEVVARTQYRGKANKGLFLLSYPEGAVLAEDAAIVSSEGEEVGKPLHIVTLWDGRKAIRAILRLAVREGEEILFWRQSLEATALALQGYDLRVTSAP